MLMISYDLVSTWCKIHHDTATPFRGIRESLGIPWYNAFIPGLNISFSTIYLGKFHHDLTATEGIMVHMVRIRGIIPIWSNISGYWSMIIYPNLYGYRGNHVQGIVIHVYIYILYTLIREESKLLVVHSSPKLTILWLFYVQCLSWDHITIDLWSLLSIYILGILGTFKYYCKHNMIVYYHYKSVL